MQYSPWKLFYCNTQSTQVERESETKCKYLEIVFYPEWEDYQPFPSQCNMGCLVITSSQDFSLIFQLKDTLLTQIYLNHYTQVHIYEVL